MGAGSSMVMAFVLHKVTGCRDDNLSPCEGGWLGVGLAGLAITGGFVLGMYQ